MESFLNFVKTKLRLDGEEVSFSSLRLDQEMNSCHRFEVVKEFMTQNEMWQKTPQKLMDMVGKRALIRFEHNNSCDFYEFSGIVTDVKIDAWEENLESKKQSRRYNRVHYIGQGDVVSLAGTPTMNSFVDSQLTSIVSQLTEGSLCEVKSNPRYQGVLPYAMQYRENEFDFLCRLANTFGELFYYDGHTLFFGAPEDSSSVSLLYDSDIYSMRLSGANLPRKQGSYLYLDSKDEFVRNDGGGDLKNGNALLKDLCSKSDSFFSNQGVTPSAAPAYDSANLYDMVTSCQNSLSGSMLNLEGETKTCKIKLGSLIEITFPKEMNVASLGKYRITKLLHRIDKKGNYSNFFCASPVGAEYLSSFYQRKVFAYPEVAIVSDNNDPESQGRVQVCFDWQKPKWISTNWIRVQTPDAGKSQDVPTNRGFVFIPEVGDQVMVGFEYGDPNRPFVMGSLFNGKTGDGGGVDNKIHSMITKSGHQIVFNDDSSEWGITISDKNGNVIKFDTKNRKITLSAGDSISLLANNITIDAEQAVSINAGENVVINAKKDVTLSANENMSLLVREDLSMTSKNVSVSVAESVQHNSDSLSFIADSEIEINSKKICIDSTKENLVLASGADVDAKAKGKVNLS